jgi:hypothetical protein
MTFRTGFAMASKVLSSSVERGEKGTSAGGGRQRCTDNASVEGSWNTKSLPFAALYFAKRYFSSIFVVQEYVYA